MCLVHLQICRQNVQFFVSKKIRVSGSCWIEGNMPCFSFSNTGSKFEDSTDLIENSQKITPQKIYRRLNTVHFLFPLQGGGEHSNSCWIEANWLSSTCSCSCKKTLWGELLKCQQTFCAHLVKVAFEVVMIVRSQDKQELFLNGKDGTEIAYMVSVLCV